MSWIERPDGRDTSGGKRERNRVIGLIVFTGLVVAWVRRGLEHHWQSFASWGDFFLSGFGHAFAVAFASVFAAAVMSGTLRFFVGSECKDDDSDKLFVCAVMTVLVVAIFLAIAASPMGPPDWNF